MTDKDKDMETPESEPQDENAEQATDEIEMAGESGEDEAAEETEVEAKADEKVAAVSEEKEKISGFAKVDLIMKGSIKTDIPEFRSGDTIKVHVKIIEGSKERIQVFEGVVIGMQHGGIDETFTVRKTSWGVGVERTFFTNSPKIAKIEVTRRGRVRRAKLYYLRERAGKSARIKERRMTVKK